MERLLYPHSRPPSLGRASLGRTRIQLFEGPRNHHCNVILLFATAAELLDRPNKCLEKGSHPKVRMAPKGIQ